LWELFSLLSEEGTNKSDKYGYVEKALEFIHANYMQDISVEKISQLLNLDRTYFSVIFKKETGISHKQYLINYRMNIAATLLVKNNFSISVIANSVGYSDSFTFSKIFKRYFGTSPSSYAAQKRTKNSLK
jgi:AraC-like DNA-binding protein